MFMGALGLKLNFNSKKCKLKKSLYENPPGGNVANGVAWYTILFKISTFNFLCQKLEIEIVCFHNPKLNPNDHYS